MKYIEDLKKDFRFNSGIDDFDPPVRVEGRIVIVEPVNFSNSVEFSKQNHRALQFAIDQCKKNGIAPKNFLEIGVCRTGDDSSTYTILKNLDSDGKYLGIDLEDKSFLNQTDKGIYTLKENSSNFSSVAAYMQKIGLDNLDFIFIDGNHSINQILRDWEYTRFLVPGGVVALHDTTAHLGPALMLRNLDRSKWMVFENLCPNDYGLGFAFKSKAQDLSVSSLCHSENEVLKRHNQLLENELSRVISEYNMLKNFIQNAG